MNRQQTITADLYGRLIHRPWCKWGEQEYRFRIAGICPSELEENKVIAIDSAYDEYYLDEIKPILFPSLTAPITVAGYNDGLAFVPIDELNRLAELNNLDLRVEWDESEDHFIIRVTFFMGGWEMDFVSNWLNQWHVNYRLLPGEYIEATNEYA